MPLVNVDRRKLIAFQNDSATTHTYTIPYSGWNVGDEAWVSVFANDGDNIANLPAPSGWTREGDVDFSASFHPAIYKRTLQSGDAGSQHSFTYVGSNQKIVSAMTIHAPGGVAVLATPTSAGSTTTCPAPTYAVTNASVAVIHAGCRGGTAPTSVSISGSGWSVATSAYGTGGGQTSIAVFENLTPVSNTTINPGNIVWDAATSTVAWMIVIPQVDSTVANYPVVSPEPNLVTAATYPVYIAHRGGSDNGPEGVMLTYRKNLGRDKQLWAEGDVHALSGTARLAVNHDATRDRLDADSLTGPVASMTESDWRARRVTWPAGYPLEVPMPAIFGDQLLDEYKSEGVYYIETKAAAAVPALLQSIYTKQMDKQVVVASFDESHIREASGAGAYTIFQTGALGVRQYAGYKAAGMWAIGVDKVNVTAQVCTEAHAAGLKVITYTVDTTGERDTLLGYGVDGIITNAPYILVASNNRVARTQKRTMNFTMMM